jgi:hypothetical protein
MVEFPLRTEPVHGGRADAQDRRHLSHSEEPISLDHGWTKRSAKRCFSLQTAAICALP